MCLNFPRFQPQCAYRRVAYIKTRPIVQRCVLSVLRYAFCDGASGNGGVGAVMVVAAAVAVAGALAEAMVPLRMILCM